MHDVSLLLAKRKQCKPDNRQDWLKRHWKNSFHAHSLPAVVVILKHKSVFCFLFWSCWVVVLTTKRSFRSWWCCNAFSDIIFWHAAVMQNCFWAKQNYRTCSSLHCWLRCTSQFNFQAEKSKQSRWEHTFHSFPTPVKLHFSCVNQRIGANHNPIQSRTHNKHWEKRIAWLSFLLKKQTEQQPNSTQNSNQIELLQMWRRSWSWEHQWNGKTKADKCQKLVNKS